MVAMLASGVRGKATTVKELVPRKHFVQKRQSRRFVLKHSADARDCGGQNLQPAVNLSSMVDADHQDQQLVIVNAHQHPVIPHPVAP
jgi:alpha-L-arabinofuranosidase